MHRLKGDVSNYKKNGNNTCAKKKRLNIIRHLKMLLPLKINQKKSHTPQIHCFRNKLNYLPLSK
jgi:hypothetical protein